MDDNPPASGQDSKPAGGSRPLLTDAELFSGILCLAGKLDVLIIPGAG